MSGHARNLSLDLFALIRADIVDSIRRTQAFRLMM